GGGGRGGGVHQGRGDDGGAAEAVADGQLAADPVDALVGPLAAVLLHFHEGGDRLTDHVLGLGGGLLVAAPGGHGDERDEQGHEQRATGHGSPPVRWDCPHATRRGSPVQGIVRSAGAFHLPWF